jgi:hypothetical protein
MKNLIVLLAPIVFVAILFILGRRDDMQAASGQLQSLGGRCRLL